MTECPICGATATDDRSTVMSSTDGPLLVTKWRCTAHSAHWWTGCTDAAEPVAGDWPAAA